MPRLLQQTTPEESAPPHPTICSRGFAIQAWSVITRLNVVFSALYISSGCIDWTK